MLWLCIILGDLTLEYFQNELLALLMQLEINSKQSLIYVNLLHKLILSDCIVLNDCQYAIRLINRLKELDVDHIIDFQQVDLAIAWARQYHGAQKRKSGELFYTHPLEVAYMVSKYLLTTDVIVTSILHDIVEDTEVTFGMILDNFSKNIAYKVEGLTRVKIDRKIPAGETVNTLFFKHQKDVLYTKLFDRLHNMRTINYLSDEKKAKIVHETILYFIPLATYLEITEVREEFKILCLAAEDKKQQCTFAPNRHKIKYRLSALAPTFQNVIEQIYNLKE